MSIGSRRARVVYRKNEIDDMECVSFNREIMRR